MPYWLKLFIDQLCLTSKILQKWIGWGGGEKDEHFNMTLKKIHLNNQQSHDRNVFNAIEKYLTVHKLDLLDATSCSRTSQCGINKTLYK